METKKKHLNKGNGSRNDEGTKRRRTDPDTDTDTVGVDGKNKQKQGIYQTADKLTSN